MQTSKCFCVNCETIQQGGSKCLKCQSDSLFHIGTIARFPKHPKKEDYEYLFGILINSMTRSYDLKNVTKIHKYITNHKYSNSINPNVKLSYKERAEALLKTANERKLQNQKKIDEKRLSGIWAFFNDDELTVLKNIGTKDKKDYYIQGLGFFLSRESYNINDETNPFRPKKAPSKWVGDAIFFKTRREALAVSATVCQKFLDSEVSEGHGKLIEFAKTYAKKQSLQDLLPEYFV